MNVPFAPISPEIDALTGRIIEAAIQVHRTLGPGLLESVYEACLCYELSKREIAFERQRSWPVTYERVRLETGLCVDLLIEGQVIVELKAVDQMIPIFDAQLLTYLKLTGIRVGLLINFNVLLLKDGIKRLVH